MVVLVRLRLAGQPLHVDRGIAQLAMFAAMATMFLVSLTIPEAFTDLPGGLYAPLMFVYLLPSGSG